MTSNRSVKVEKNVQSASRSRLALSPLHTYHIVVVLALSREFTLLFYGDVAEWFKAALC